MPIWGMNFTMIWVIWSLLLSLFGVDGAAIIPSYAAAFVNAHNVKRCMHGVPPMTWSSAVEATAVTWAATCSGDHTNLTVRMNDWFGENLWGVSGMEPFPQGAVTLWYNEISIYDWSNPILQPGTGHMTQVIWRSSVNLGCAMCDRGDGWKWVVCQYNPPGNAPGNNEILPPIKSEAECIAEVLPNAYNCVDDPTGWTDSTGRSCAAYAQQGYCQPDGTLGSNWNTGAWGPVSKYANQGKDAFQACCACGGGRFVSPSPSPSASLSPSPSVTPSPKKSPPLYVPDASNCVDDPVGWTDSYGWACSSYLSQNWCTTDGEVASGWQAWWGPISRYANQGKDAFAACCACGGGKFVSPSPSPSPSPVSPATPSPPASVSPSPLASASTSPSLSARPSASPAASASASTSPAASRSPAASASPSPRPSSSPSHSPVMCVDAPLGWTDSDMFACSDYVKYKWCKPDGSVGSGWSYSWGKITDYTYLGKNAFQACCACGGGAIVSMPDPVLPSPSALPSTSPRPSASPQPSASLAASPRRSAQPSASPQPSVCVDSISNWKDMYGFSCAYWVSHQFCTSAGTTGAGWQPDWGSPSLYTCQGQTALQACCGCGGGTWIPASASPSPMVALPSSSPSPAASASAARSPSPSVSLRATPPPSASASASPPRSALPSVSPATSASPQPSTSTSTSPSPKPQPSASPAALVAPPSPSASPIPLPSTSGTKCADEQGVCTCTGLVQFGISDSWTDPRTVTGQISCTTNQFGDPRPGKVKACYCLPATPLPSASASASPPRSAPPSASPNPSGSPKPSPSPTAPIVPQSSPSARPSASPIPLPSTSGTKCADEQGVCTCTGLVQFGISDSWTDPRTVSGQIACTTNQFGDPRPGKVKACYCLPDSASASLSAAVAPPSSPSAQPSASPVPLPSTSGTKCADELGVCTCTGFVQFGIGTTWSDPRTVSGQIACTTNQFGDPRPGKVKACYCLPATTRALAMDSATTDPSPAETTSSSNVWPWLALPFAFLALAVALGALFCLHRHRRAQRQAETTFLDPEGLGQCLGPVADCLAPAAVTVPEDTPAPSGGCKSPSAPPPSRSASPVPPTCAPDHV